MIRILGSITPYRTSTTKLTAMYTNATNRLTPAIAGTSLDDAWMSPTAAMEEDEAEFIDAVADCLGVGLSLDAALNCWDSGGLFYDDGDGDDDLVAAGQVSPDHARADEVALGRETGR